MGVKKKAVKKTKEEKAEEEEAATLEVRCLDDGQTYQIESADPIGVINTNKDTMARLKVPSTQAQSSATTYGVEAKKSLSKEEEAEMKKHEDSRRSSKNRMGQRLQENVGLLKTTKDVNFVAARQRVKVHLERISRIEECVKQRDAAIKTLLEKEAELCINIEEMAAKSPIEIGANAFVQDYERRRRKLENSLLRLHVQTVTTMCERWRENLIRIEAEVARDQEAARVQLDHYAYKAENLRKAKEKRDLQRLEKQTEIANRTKPGEAPPPVPAVSHKADEKYVRNEAKYKAAQRDYETTTQSAVRAYDTAVMDRWHDLSPLFSELVDFDKSLTALIGVEAMPLRKTMEDSIKNCPPVIPLASRVVSARAGTLEKDTGAIKPQERPDDLNGKTTQKAPKEQAQQQPPRRKAPLPPPPPPKSQRYGNNDKDTNPEVSNEPINIETAPSRTYTYADVPDSDSEYDQEENGDYGDDGAYHIGSSAEQDGAPTYSAMAAIDL